MLKELLRPEIEDLIHRKDWTVLRETLEMWPAPELSDLKSLALRVANVENPAVRHPLCNHPQASTLISVRLHLP